MDTYQSSLTSPTDKTTEFVKSRADPLTSTETEIAVPLPSIRILPLCVAILHI